VYNATPLTNNVKGQIDLRCYLESVKFFLLGKPKSEKRLPRYIWNGQQNIFDLYEDEGDKLYVKFIKFVYDITTPNKWAIRDWRDFRSRKPHPWLDENISLNFETQLDHWNFYRDFRKEFPKLR